MAKEVRQHEVYRVRRTRVLFDFREYGCLPQQTRIASIGWVRLLKTLPGIGTILGCTIYLAIGDVGRFATAEKLASYAGLVPTVHASGGRLWQGPIPRSANHFLKWAFIEAANVVVSHRKQWEQRHVVRLYQRLRAAKCHGKAATAVARYLAESSWEMLRNKQPYREPAPAHGKGVF